MALLAAGHAAIDPGHVEPGLALQPVVDQQVGIEIGDHRRVMLQRRQRPAQARDQPEAVGRAGRGQHMMADFMREDFGRMVVELQRGDRFQVDDHALVDQPDHRERTGQPLLRRRHAAVAQARIA